MDKVDFPRNIKQIGSIGSNKKIYIEDYVFTYLNEYANAPESSEKLALLVGNNIVIDGIETLFINGAIKGEFVKKENDINIFTDEFWIYAKMQIKEYFADCEIVGLMQSQPGYGLYLNMNYSNYFMNNFTYKHQVLFLLDPLEKMNCFYIWDDEQKDLIESTGYFIYYEQNENMHEYMINNPISKYKVKNTTQKGNIAENKKTEVRFVSEERTKRVFNEQKKLINMLISLAAVLFLICFVMGAGLMQNEDRITALEKDLSQVSYAYNNIMGQLRQDNAQSVFAAQQDVEQIVEPKATIINENMSTPTVTLIPDTDSISNNVYDEIDNMIDDDVNNNTITYEVKEGDTLGYISQRFYGDSSMVTHIMELNNIEESDMIYLGQVLTLPDKI
jgi:LysM repeat protein